MGMKQGRRLFSGANNNIVHKTELSPQSEMLTKWKWKIVYYKILYELGREVLTIQVHKDKKFNYDNEDVAVMSGILLHKIEHSPVFV